MLIRHFGCRLLNGLRKTFRPLAILSPVSFPCLLTIANDTLSSLKFAPPNPPKIALDESCPVAMTSKPF